ncbi:aldo/keto reductase [Conexibacter sp. SYSU D00693]|uniref:aldo/keto reductase n=1 Tax=Conexibacter sp. SYSU D00693 TaxID=2812560 RepID=UPI00196AE178|nr:aldo/keto reductase [Conexibacter sp. SYSU D00693]
MRRALGSTGLEVHPLCLGGNVFGWTVDGEQAFDVLDLFADATGGAGLVDTADAYSSWVPGHEGGESERLIGAWMRDRGRRGAVLLATKVGWQGGLGADHVRRSAAACLERLGVERVDLLYAHKDDPSTPLEETLRALDAVVRDGGAAHLGLSNYAPGRVREALAICDREGLTRPTVLQPPYSLVARGEFEGELQRLAVEERLGVAPYAALAGGFLTGKYTRGEAHQGARAGAVSRFEDDDAAWATVEALREIATARGVTPAAVAVAWVVAQEGVTAAIASATRTDQLRDLLAGAELELSAGELERLR